MVLTWELVRTTLALADECGDATDVHDDTTTSEVGPAREASRPGEGMAMMRTPSDAIRDSPVRLMPGRYAVVRCAEVPRGSDWFVVARDTDEVTVIAEESALPGLRAVETERGYRLVEIRAATGLQSVGFLAVVTRALAEAGLNVLVVSTYSKDYVLLKEESVAAGLQALAAVGFPVVGS